MNNKTKVLIIGAGPTSAEIAIIAKRISEKICVTLVDCQDSFAKAYQEMNKISELHSKSINDFSKDVNDYKASLKILENSQPKSKYINKPRNNFKQRGYKNRYR